MGIGRSKDFLVKWTIVSNMKGTRKSSTARDEPALLREVEAVYEELANRPIERSCVTRTNCCRFKLTGEIPYVTRGEALLAAHAWRATGRKSLEESSDSDGRCAFLNPGDQRCRVYSARPFACRTHFCAAAGGPYRRREVLDLIRRLEDIDRRLGGTCGSRPLVPAVSEALENIPLK
jgi:Fe-S-cluster containining protein